MKKFDSELVYHDKYIKTKINLHNGKLNTKFHKYKLPPVGKVDKKHYL